jgi:hypothetical protein
MKQADAVKHICRMAKRMGCNHFKVYFRGEEVTSPSELGRAIYRKRQVARDIMLVPR